LVVEHARSVGQSVATVQPQMPPVTHASPFWFPVQSVQFTPQPFGLVSATQAAPTQQSPAPQVPSPATPHAAVQTPALHVGVSPEHAVQAVPLLPHVGLDVPAMQMLPGAVRRGAQQPPLHAEYAAVPQSGPHVDVDLSHAWFAGQSPGPLQPQRPPTHPVPLVFPTQLVQPGPHASPEVSATHALPTQQLPAPHTPSPACPQAAVHEPPAPHVGVPPEQPTQAAPVAPHAPFTVPATH
jgi:hypothetical protein